MEHVLYVTAFKFGKAIACVTIRVWNDANEANRWAESWRLPPSTNEFKRDTIPDPEH
eukprot:m.19477 g.19477  ORF g.19477 m.19477 type:complete len:57 (+) comp8040_c0_seq1:720-890(+)